MIRGLGWHEPRSFGSGAFLNHYAITSSTMAGTVGGAVGSKRFDLPQNAASESCRICDGTSLRLIEALTG
jgi:hypothetical protein